VRISHCPLHTNMARLVRKTLGWYFWVAKKHQAQSYRHTASPQILQGHQHRSPSHRITRSWYTCRRCHPFLTDVSTGLWAEVAYIVDEKSASGESAATGVGGPDDDRVQIDFEQLINRSMLPSNTTGTFPVSLLCKSCSESTGDGY